MLAASEPSRKSSEAADVKIPYEINVILLVTDKAESPFSRQPAMRFRLCSRRFPDINWCQNYVIDFFAPALSLFEWH
jgi:hypothetical protein